MTKEDLIYYLLISIFSIFMLNPNNIKYRHIHLTTTLIISYLILFPSKCMKIKKYLYDLRGILLVYFIIDFNVDPLISLFLFILYLMIVYQIQYDRNYTSEHFTNMNTIVKKNLKQTDNYNYDNKQYIIDSEYKKYNEEDIANGTKYISDKQLDDISNNKTENMDNINVKDSKDNKDKYNIQGTNFTMGYNYNNYGDLDKSD